MLYLEDIKVGDRFISREYEMTLEEIKQFAHAYDPQVFIPMKIRLKSIQFFRAMLPAAGSLLLSPCVYGLSVFR